MDYRTKYETKDNKASKVEKADYLHDPGVQSYFLNKTQKH